LQGGSDSKPTSATSRRGKRNRKGGGRLPKENQGRNLTNATCLPTEADQATRRKTTPQLKKLDPAFYERRKNGKSGGKVETRRGKRRKQKKRCYTILRKGEMGERDTSDSAGLSERSRPPSQRWSRPANRVSSPSPRTTCWKGHITGSRASFERSRGISLKEFLGGKSR